MRRIGIACAAALLALAAISCEPQVFVMNLETMGPSEVGVDLTGKKLAVVYLEDPSGRDSVFTGGMAQGFASQLEKDYYNGQEAIGIYRMVKSEGNYASRDTLLNLVMDTAGDVVFLFDKPEYGDITLSRDAGEEKSVHAALPYAFDMYVYDTMDKADTVRLFTGYSTARHSLTVADGEDDDTVKAKMWDVLGIHGESAGARSATKFSPTWKDEEFIFYYQERPHKWYQATEAADQCEWRKAIDYWMELADTDSPVQLACASFDLATVFYLLGDYELATKWLDVSDKANKLGYSSRLRSKINAKK